MAWFWIRVKFHNQWWPSSPAHMCVTRSICQPIANEETDRFQTAIFFFIKTCLSHWLLGNLNVIICSISKNILVTDILTISYETAIQMKVKELGPLLSKRHCFTSLTFHWLFFGHFYFSQTTRCITKVMLLLQLQFWRTIWRTNHLNWLS